MEPSSALRPRTLLGLSVALVLVLAACGGDSAGSTTVPPTTDATPVTTTTTSATTSTSTPTTTTTQATTTTSVTTTTIDTNTLAEGSGCTPGGDELPDGEWYGLVVSAAAGSIDFDLACWFTGEAAVLASAEDGEESPPPNDYYVRNVNAQLRTLDVSATAEVAWLPNVGDPSGEESLTYAEWLDAREARGVDLQPGVWIVVEEGSVTSIREQYVP